MTKGIAETQTLVERQDQTARNTLCPPGPRSPDTPESHFLTDTSLPGCEFKVSSPGASPSSQHPGASAHCPPPHLPTPRLRQEPVFLWESWHLPAAPPPHPAAPLPQNRHSLATSESRLLTTAFPPAGEKPENGPRLICKSQRVAQSSEFSVRRER